jgi:hypothetical protein
VALDINAQKIKRNLIMTIDQQSDEPRKNLKCSKKNPVLTDILEEGHALLEADLAKTVSKPVEAIKNTPSVTKTSASLFVNAHKKVLDNWKKNPKTKWRALEVEAIERGEYPKDRFYDEFVQEVALAAYSLE